MTKYLSTIISFFTLAAAVAGGILYLDKYQTVKAAEESEKRIEQKSVQTFEAQQKVLDIKLKSAEYKYDRDRLDFLRTQKLLLEKQYEETPTDLLKEKLELLIGKIEKLENKLEE